MFKFSRRIGLFQLLMGLFVTCVTLACGRLAFELFLRAKPTPLDLIKLRLSDFDAQPSGWQLVKYSEEANNLIFRLRELSSEEEVILGFRRRRGVILYGLPGYPHLEEGFTRVDQRPIATKVGSFRFDLWQRNAGAGQWQTQMFILGVFDGVEWNSTLDKSRLLRPSDIYAEVLIARRVNEKVQPDMETTPVFRLLEAIIDQLGPNGFGSKGPLKR